MIKKLSYLKVELLYVLFFLCLSMTLHGQNRSYNEVSEARFKEYTQVILDAYNNKDLLHDDYEVEVYFFLNCDLTSEALS